MINEEENTNKIEIFISGLDECREEIKLILNELERVDEEESLDCNIIGNSYVKSLLLENSPLNKNKDKEIDTISNEEYISLFIGVIARENNNSKYPNINLKNDYCDFLKKVDADYFMFFLKKEANDTVNIETKKIKKSINEIEFDFFEYGNIAEFEAVLSEEINGWQKFLNEDIGDLSEFLDLIMERMGSSESEVDPQKMLEEIFKKASGLEESDETPKEVTTQLEEFLENFGYSDEEELEKFESDSLDTNQEIINMLKENYVIDDSTFSRGNLFMNLEEYLLVNFIELTNFMEYEAEEGEEKELYNSATIFSEKLDTILKIFEDKVLKSSDFIKIKENNKEFIKEIGNDETFEMFKTTNNIEDNKSMFQSIIVYMQGLHQMAKEDPIDVDDYDELLSKFIANLELTVKNFQIIGEIVETLGDS